MLRASSSMRSPLVIFRRAAALALDFARSSSVGLCFFFGFGYLCTVFSCRARQQKTRRRAGLGKSVLGVGLCGFVKVLWPYAISLESEHKRRPHILVYVNFTPGCGSTHGTLCSVWHQHSDAVPTRWAGDDLPSSSHCLLSFPRETPFLLYGIFALFYLVGDRNVLDFQGVQGCPPRTKP